MAGILDSKTRIMDVIVTQEGRRQIASGKMRPEFISFTDGHTFYQKEGMQGNEDPTTRIYFEATSRLNDSITLESDDSGNLVQFDFSPKHTLVGEELFTVTSSSPDLSNNKFRIHNFGSQFASTGKLIASASINNFKNLYMIGTRNGVEAELPGDGFALSSNTARFSIKNYSPWIDGAHNQKITIDAIEPLFTDKRLSHLPNFKYLPPETITGNPLGDYPNVNESAPLTYPELMKEIAIKKPEEFAKSDSLDPFDHPKRRNLLKNFMKPEGVMATKEGKTIQFTNTSKTNNVVMQMFELSDNKFKKLDIIDFGTFNDPQDFDRPEKHIFFAGKVYVDSNGSPTFVNLFTFILD